jgi:hypothetical protein
MFADDSFFTLTVRGQIGLVLISALSSIALLVVTRLATAHRPRLFRLGVALCAFYLFVWVSPQMYYQYYRTLFDGLPQHSVISSPPSIWAIADLLRFKGPSTLSNLGLGSLGWALLITALPGNRVFRRNAAN